MEKDGVQIFIPALLREDDHEIPSTDTHIPRWDGLISKVVRSDVASQCSALGGDLYVLNGGDDWGVGVLWSAACCSVPGGRGGFGTAIIIETLHDHVHVKGLSVERLQETLGVQELFSGGCGEADDGSAGVTLDLQTQDRAATDKTEDLDSTQAASRSDARDSDVTEKPASVTESGRDSDVNEKSAGVKESGRDSDVNEKPASVTESGRDSDVTEKSAWVKESGGGIQEADETRDVERVAEQKDKADGNSSNIVVSIFSTTLSILKAPLRPIFSRITQFPGQVKDLFQVLLFLINYSKYCVLLLLNICNFYKSHQG